MQDKNSPSPSEIRALLEDHHLASSEAARLIGVNQRTFRKWMSGARRMPWASWTLLRVITQEISQDEIVLSQSGAPDCENTERS